MQLYAREVFNGLVAEDGMEIEIPDADYLSIQTLSYLVASGTNTLTVRVYDSHDGVSWNSFGAPISGASVTTRQVNSAAGGVDLSTAGPRLRLDVNTGASCMAHVRVFVMGRAKKRNPAVRAAAARQAAARQQRERQAPVPTPVPATAMARWAPPVADKPCSCKDG